MKRFGWMQRGGCVWAAVGAFAGVVLLALLLLLTGLARRGAVEFAAPVVTVLPRPTATVAVLVPPSPTPTETAEAALPSDPGRIAVGLIVEVFGTEGDGLRLRELPGTSGAIQVLAGESEVFAVQDGPVEADGRTWFYLVSPSDAARAGWAVTDYLRLAQ
jgi:hypothetical protein